ncbi:DUF1731 domain-containing protein [Thermicanus aegyptius]
MKVALGEMELLLLEGNKADSAPLQQLGYSFQYPILRPALKNLFS